MFKMTGEKIRKLPEKNHIRYFQLSWLVESKPRLLLGCCFFWLCSCLCSSTCWNCFAELLDKKNTTCVFCFADDFFAPVILQCTSSVFPSLLDSRCFDLQFSEEAMLVGNSGKCDWRHLSWGKLFLPVIINDRFKVAKNFLLGFQKTYTKIRICFKIHPYIHTNTYPLLTLKMLVLVMKSIDGNFPDSQVKVVSTSGWAGRKHPCIN